MWPACGFQAPEEGRLVSHHFGGHSERETPLPIPNRVVKPLSADGTWPARAWESRSPPINLRAVLFGAARFCLGVWGGRFLPCASDTPSSASASPHERGCIRV